MSDKINCQFYTRIGACRHGEKCSRRHIKPTSSNTIILSNLYQNPKLNKNVQDLNPLQIKEYFENFYKDIFIRIAKIGEIEDIVVCENENNHLNGNVYLKFRDSDFAQSAVIELNQDWFGGRPVHCELSPVASFQDATCRAYDNNSCKRELCNFMHIIRPSHEVKMMLLKGQEKSILLKNLIKVKQQLDHNETSELKQPEQEQDASTESTVEQPPTDIKSTVANLFSK